MSLKTVPFENVGTVSYSHSIATMAVSLAVSTQYTNATDRHCTTTKAALMRSIATSVQCMAVFKRGLRIQTPSEIMTNKKF